MTTTDKDCDINVAEQARKVVEHTLEVCLTTLQCQVQDLASKRETTRLQLAFLNQLEEELETGIEETTDQICVVKSQLKTVRGTQRI